MDKDRIAGDSDLYGFTYYLYGRAYLGSYRGMRFRLGREPLKNVFFSPKEEWGKEPEGEACFLASTWDEPYSYDKQTPETLTEERFPFNEEGLKAAVAWIYSRYEEGYRK